MHKIFAPHILPAKKETAAAYLPPPLGGRVVVKVGGVVWRHPWHPKTVSKGNFWNGVRVGIVAPKLGTFRNRVTGNRAPVSEDFKAAL